MRTWRWFSVFAVLILVLAACGQQGTSEEPAGSEPPAGTEGPAPTELRLVIRPLQTPEPARGASASIEPEGSAWQLAPSQPGEPS